MDKIIEFDLVWLQSTPAIAAIFYKKYLQPTHAVYCPDKKGASATPRILTRHMIQLLDEKKKLAIYFTQPITEKKRDSLFNLLIKLKPLLSCFCLSIPMTEYQWNLLLGWSAETSDPEWKRQCEVEYDPEAFYPFAPPTLTAAQSEWIEFETDHVISNEVFYKQALLVDITKDMVAFNEEGKLYLKEGTRNAIRGLMDASPMTSTMIWIIDEEHLYAKKVNCALQREKKSMLARYREEFRLLVEAFATTMPIYCYKMRSSSLTNCLAQIKHRHHISYSRSLLITDNSSLHEQDLFDIKIVHLYAYGNMIASKWTSIFLPHLEKLESCSYDEINYISPDILDIEWTQEQYKIPLLSLANTEPLTHSEHIGLDGTVHSVSAQSVNVFDHWAQTLIETKPEEIKTNESTPDSILNIFERVQRSLTHDTIKHYFQNEESFNDGEKILDVLTDTLYDMDTHTVILNAQLETYNITIKLTADGTVAKGECSCSVEKCQHCAATLLCFHRHADRFKLGLPACFSSSFRSDSSNHKPQPSTETRKSRSSQDSNQPSDETKSSLDINQPRHEIVSSSGSEQKLEISSTSSQHSGSGSQGKRIRSSPELNDDDDKSISKRSKSSQEDDVQEVIKSTSQEAVESGGYTLPSFPSIPSDPTSSDSKSLSSQFLSSLSSQHNSSSLSSSGKKSVLSILSLPSTPSLPDSRLISSDHEPQSEAQPWQDVFAQEHRPLERYTSNNSSGHFSGDSTQRSGFGNSASRFTEAIPYVDDSIPIMGEPSSHDGSSPFIFLSPQDSEEVPHDAPSRRYNLRSVQPTLDENDDAPTQQRDDNAPTQRYDTPTQPYDEEPTLPYDEEPTLSYDELSQDMHQSEKNDKKKEKKTVILDSDDDEEVDTQCDSMNTSDWLQNLI